MTVDFEQPSELITCAVFKLKDESVWREFNAIGNEMIITKNGRCLFPLLRFSVEFPFRDCKKDQLLQTVYNISLDIQTVDDFKWKFIGGRWRSVGQFPKSTNTSKIPSNKVPAFGSPMTLAEMIEKCEISFSKAKLTNSQCRTKEPNRILLTSFRRYIPVVIFENANTGFFHNWSIREAQFIAVTHYQNPRICELKKTLNPHAKGFLNQQLPSDALEDDLDEPLIEESYENTILDGKDFIAVFLLNSLKTRFN
jgi:T-box protein 19